MSFARHSTFGESIGFAAQAAQLHAAVMRDQFRLIGVPESAIQQHTGHWHGPAYVAQYRSDGVEQWLGDPDTFFRVVAAGSRVIALCVGRRSTREDRANYLSILQVQREHRGRGIGARLLRAFVDFGNPAADTTLNVLVGNKPAVQFYQKAGFEFSGRARVDPVGDQFVMLREMILPATSPIAENEPEFGHPNV